MGAETYNRRVFFERTAKAVRRVAAGVVVGEALVHIHPRIDQAIEQTTGHMSGNANIVDTDFRHDQPDWGAGLPVDPEKARNYSRTVGPVFEELVYRAIPSGFTSTLDDREEPAMDMIVGTGGVKMTRKEVIGGIITSVLFGAVHNVTRKGIDRRVIPGSVTFGGAVLWYLQRKLGLGANTVAHLWFNNRTIK